MTASGDPALPTTQATSVEAGRPARQRSLDALRGVAAVVVMGYHFSRRYGERFDPDWHPTWSYDGQFGVLLFFMISGYVITLTTHRVRRPSDFLFFRFSRLYPTFWACMTITTVMMLTCRLPISLSTDKTPFAPPTVQSVAATATMLAKSIRRLPHVSKDLPYVDGSYWSLEIELFFYLVVSVLLAMRQMRHIVRVAIGFTILSLIDMWEIRAKRNGLPSIIQWGFFLEYWPYFGIGIAVYAWQHGKQRIGPIVLVLLAAATTAAGGGLFFFKIAVCAGVFVVAVFDWLPPLRWGPLVWLGAISYPLYLLHQNLGYVVIHKAVKSGVSTNVAILLAMAIAITLATAVSFGIERPTIRWLRRLYLRRASV